MPKIIQHKEYLLIEVPKDATDFVIDDELFYKSNWLGLSIKKLPAGDWQLVGKADELTEEQAKGVVDEPVKSVGDTGWLYTNYNLENDRIAFLLTALESFASLLTHHNLEANTTLVIYKK